MEAIRRELRDRFGPVPHEAETLLATAALRLLGHASWASSVSLYGPGTRGSTSARESCRAMVALQRAFSDRQLEVELQRTLPLSLLLHRRGPEPVERTLIGALLALTRDKTLAA